MRCPDRCLPPGHNQYHVGRQYQTYIWNFSSIIHVRQGIVFELPEYGLPVNVVVIVVSVLNYNPVNESGNL